jgi:uncharacterized protein
VSAADPGSSSIGPSVVEHILQFVRLLRAAGLPVGPDRAVLATEAVLAAGIASPGVLYWTLHAVLVTRREQHEVFDQAFFLFWKEPAYLQQMLELTLPGSAAGSQPPGARELARRLGEALLPQARRPLAEAECADTDARETFSAAEVLREKDFEAMSADELRRAREAIAAMSLVMQQIRTRRFRPAARGERIDLKAVLRETAARGPDHLRPSFKTRRLRRPPLVVLCDISGSMETYARMLLHFLYTLTNARDSVHAFLFGTRLTNVTRALKGRDADLGIAKVARDVKDWSGGTRIGDSLAEFNRLWARRVLGQNALVLLITDGLDRDGGAGIGAAARRLKAACRRLVWMNPLLRYDGYSPLASGARELAPHVSEMRPCHNIKSLEDLVAALGPGPSPRQR